MYEYDTHMSTPGNTAKPLKSHTQQHTDSTKKSVPGWERTYNALVSTPLSQHSNTLCQPGIKDVLWNCYSFNLSSESLDNIYRGQFMADLILS